MRDLKKYQEKALYSKKKVMLCNWKRRNGKTYTISEIIYFDFLLAKKDNSIAVISGCNKGVECKIVSDYLRELTKSEEFKIQFLKEEIKIKNKKGIMTTIKFINANDFIDSKHILQDMQVQKVYCDEYMPTKSEIDDILKLNCVEKVKIFFTYMDNEDFEYISDVENKINKGDWIEQQIEDLMGEYSSISKCENTTIRREKVLTQIKMLKDLFNN